ncbi:MAG: hypothetical protein NTX24_03965 [Candidatus Pacearchaeota archaeon]|nr:hypothetical protein [Candidatus Pacearchaeota archaeon]
MRMSKKGQAAMEFLMTYGWAILIAIIAIAALIAFGVLNPSVQESCGVGGTIITGVTCDMASATATGLEASIVVTNNLGDTVQFTGVPTGVTVKGQTGCTVTAPAAATDVVAGASVTFTVTCTGTAIGAGKAFDASMTGGTYTLNGQVYPYAFKFIKKVHAA